MSSNIRRIASDSDDSTEDLILKEDVSLSPNGMLSTEPYLNYTVEVPHHTDTKKYRCRYRILLVVVVVLFIVCTAFICLYFQEKHLQQLKVQKEHKYCNTASCVEAAAFIKTAMEESIDPCEDFYLYSCGGWLANNPLPDGKGRWGIDSLLYEKNQYVLKTVLQDVSINASSASSRAEFNSIKLYRSCMDMKKIQELGVSPLANILKKIGEFVTGDTKNYSKNSKKSLLQTLLKNMHTYAHMSTLFHLSVGPDDKHSEKNIMKFSQAGIGLPMFRYKANDSNEVIQAYKSYLVALGSKIDTSIPIEKFHKLADEVYRFEKNLSQIYVPREDLITVDAAYHAMTLDELSKLTPSIDWLNYTDLLFRMTDTKIFGNESIVVTTLDYFKKLEKLLDQTEYRVIHNQALFRIVTAYAHLLTDDVITLKKNLSIASNGVYKKIERWRKCVASTDANLGMAAGSLFAKKSFGKDSNKEANTMVANVRDALIQSFQTLPWMDEKTKKAATEKANGVLQKIGYPKFILNPIELDKHYEGLEEMEEDEYFQNEFKIGNHELEKEFKKLRKPVDKNEWYMTPPTVNAYYEPSSNQIVFPAGILQPPYFKGDYPKVVNYGSMGAVIGHEITHGFDNNGRLYDKNGNFHGENDSWWTQASIDGFNERKKCFADQYSKFIMAGRHIKGNVTLGENIADNGGLKAAYRAYKNWVAKNGEELLLPGLSLTNDQVFFISFGQSWCTEELTKRLISQIETDPHSPAIERVRGSVENDLDFGKIFNCPIGSNMNPKKKCSIW